MIFAVDVQYESDRAAGRGLAAGILFPVWDSDEVYREMVKPVENVAPYEPGAFYKRELPCILSLLEEVDVALEAIVVDGYVTLGQDNRIGLGMHLYERIGGRSPVVGVAKNRFKDTPEVCELLRGSSQSPLLITAVGVPLVVSKENIARMHGAHRIPTLLKRVDQLCRGIIV